MGGFHPFLFKLHVEHLPLTWQPAMQDRIYYDLQQEVSAGLPFSLQLCHADVL